ncbi:MAG: hypothetical protein MZV64_30800 [Ignavibacteriales bacterium]|nr:hypothetical protein [Ignavibacteriales bacterium]
MTWIGSSTIAVLERDDLENVVAIALEVARAGARRGCRAARGRPGRPGADRRRRPSRP